MAIANSTKTTVSIYTFSNEDEYRQWLSSNKTRTNDILAFVENPIMNNGYDMFLNGHSLTKTRFFLYSGGRSTEITSTSVFNPSKQYVIKSISRNGLGEKQMVTLEEIDINDIHNSIKNDVVSTVGSMVDEKIEEYMEEHPIEFDTDEFNSEKYNTILTHNHYILRKLYSLIYKGTSSPITFTAELLDSNYEAFSSLLFKRGSNVGVGGVLLNIAGAEEFDVEFSQIIILNNAGNIVKRVDGSAISQGRMEIRFDNDLIIRDDYKFTIRLGYTINNYPSAYKNSLPDNYDKVAEVGRLNKTGVNDMENVTIEMKFVNAAGDEPQDGDTAFFMFAIPYSTSPEDLARYENVGYLTGDILNSTIQVVKTYDLSSLKIKPNVQSWLYVAIPYTMADGIVQIQPTGGFPDVLTNQINTANYDDKLYVLYREDFAQDALDADDNQLTYKVVYED